MLYISPSLAEQGPIGGPCDPAKIGYHTVTRDAIVTASSAVPGFPASALKNALTYEAWRPESSPAWVVFDAQRLVDIDYVGLGVHTLGTEGVTLTIEHSIDGSTWEQVVQFLVGTDDAVMALFDQVTARYFRLSFNRVAQVSVAYIGRILTMQRPIYSGHSPGVLSRTTKIDPNKSEGGQFLGRSVIRQGLATSFQWQNLSPDWYRANFDPFVESAIRYPFFIAWKPTRYPQEVMYCWCNDDIHPQNSGVRDFMSVGFSVEGVR